MQCSYVAGAPSKAGVGKSGNRRVSRLPNGARGGLLVTGRTAAGGCVGPPSYAGMTEPEEEPGINKAERLWNLRDGVLAWLYGLRVDGAAIAEALPAPFMAATSWPDTEVTRVELNAAVEWLKDEGYVDGIGTMQGVVVRPHLTPYGEKYAASGRSVRDLPGVIEVNSPYLHIEGSSGVAVAFESSNVTQTVNVQQKVEQAQALVDAIERALPAVTDDRVRTEAEQLALEIRAASDPEASKPGRFKELATKAMTSLATSIATTAGSDLGKAIIEAALPLVS